MALAILALEGANLLLLDEPTNHLDIPAREALQDVLDGFTGTILLVSHDRYLIDQLATQIWEITAGKLQVFKGSYREYILRRSAFIPSAAAPHILLKARPLERDNSKETRRRQQALSLLEERIREQELAIQRLSSKLQEAGKRSDFDQMHKISWQVAHTQASLETLVSEWEKLVE
jgi:ATP-binding cassette subfamily F protein 3